jgi:hypothetical protein
VEKPFTSMPEESQAGSLECQEQADVFYVDRIVHYRFVSQGNTVDKDFNKGVLQCIRETVRQKHQGKWHADDWMLHHDNATSHTTLSVQYLARNNMVMILHSPYFPDLAHGDFFLFP